MAVQAKKAPSQEELKRSQENYHFIIAGLEQEADDRVGKRSHLEQRWLEDLRQFHGNYDEKISRDLIENKKSTLFINATRSKTNAMEARLSDMLFPTDDRNWGISPTPVPELTIGAEKAAKKARDSKIAAEEAGDSNPALRAKADADANDLALLQAQLDEAKDRAQSMQAEIDDALRESNYPSHARNVIRDACKIGTGVMKGPVAGGKPRRTWVKEDGQNNVFRMETQEGHKPFNRRVDPWNFFPDMDASNMDECESVFERHLFNKKQMRRLAKQSGFDKRAIRQLLMLEPTASVPTYLSDLRSITGAQNGFSRDRYHVWEYHGPLTAQDLEQLALATSDTDMLQDIDQELDPLEEVQVVIWFCQGVMLKMGLHHLDSEDSIYSVFNLEKDEASVFGFGMPFIMRDPQKALAGAWRTLMDNMGLSSGPQIVINDDVVEPVDGEWKLTPRKLWRRKGTAPADKKPFETFNIESHIQDLLAIIDVSKKNIDEETALPMLAQGDQSSQITKTAGGMSILMNSVNIVFRRIVKNWDDDMTTPTIRRNYDWLMQFSEKDYIKGDYDVDARGTSVLLVREMQSANLLAFLLHFGAHPILAKFLKEEGLPALRRLAQVLMIPPDDVVKTDDEIAEDAAKAAGEPPTPEPEMEKIAASMNLEQMRGDNALQLEGMKRETALIQLAASHNMELEKLKAMLYDKQQDRDSDERKLAAEAAVTERSGPSGGGYF